jgi:hypothetical protein
MSHGEVMKTHLQTNQTSMGISFMYKNEAGISHAHEIYQNITKVDIHVGGACMNMMIAFRNST